MLKETIDRMRFEMDELRTAVVGGGGSGAPSIKGSVSRSLGAELLKMNSGEWDRDQGHVEEHEHDPLYHGHEHEEDVHSDEEETDEGEDVIQTIITRTKRVSTAIIWFSRVSC